MDVGMMMVSAAHGWENIGDDQVWDEELCVARQAADLGSDVLWSAEHRSFDYICWPKADEVEELAREPMGSFVHSNFEHYDAYAQKAAIAEAAGIDGAIAGLMKAAVWGTPDRVLRELDARRGVIGDFELNAAFRFAGIPYETAEKSLRLFARKVLPVLQSWKAETIASAAAE
jgi:hypothetical protein